MGHNHVPEVRAGEAEGDRCPLLAAVVLECLVSRARFFFNISAHADGARRGPVSIGRCLKTRLTRGPSVAAPRFGLALGVRRRHAPKIG